MRDVFRKAFEAAELPYYNPHTFRDMLVRHAMAMNLSVMEMKAWSQNLGHTDLMTTFTSYGNVPTHRQGELIRATGNSDCDELDDRALMAALQKRLGKTA